MNLSDFRQAYYDYSAKASDIARKLAFAGIAIVWIFRTGGAATAEVPRGLLPPLLSFAASLALDLLHNLAGTAVWGVFCRLKERQGIGPEDELDAPAWVNWGTNLLFYAKITSVAGGYLVLIWFLCAKWAAA